MDESITPRPDESPADPVETPVANESSPEPAGPSRRGFFGIAAGLAGAAALLHPRPAAAEVDAPVTKDADGPAVRTFVSGNFFLDLNGKTVGAIRAVAGGGAGAAVVEESAGSQFYVKKHLGPLEYEDVVVQTDLSLDASFYSEISAMFRGEGRRLNGRIITADFNFNAVRVREFTEALISEVGIPACDGSAGKTAGVLTVRFTPESTKTAKASGKVAFSAGRGAKSWLPSNFRLTIDGLDCAFVTKVDAFVVKQGFVESELGDDRFSELELAKLSFPNLRVQLTGRSVQSWTDWFDKFVIKGHASDTDEKNGRLEFLDPTLKNPLLTVNFFNLGIFSLTDAPSNDPTGRSASQRVDAELYCERMEFALGKTK